MVNKYICIKWELLEILLSITSHTILNTDGIVCGPTMSYMYVKMRLYDTCYDISADFMSK